jgi:hypothetical protein
MKLTCALLATLTAACGIDDVATTSDSQEVTTTTGPAFLYPGAGTTYVVKGLTGVQCVDGSYAISCAADAIDFTLSGLSSAQISDLRARFAAGAPNPADATVIVFGQWQTVLVRDHRYNPPLSYERVDFQVTTAYETPTPGPHETTFYRLTGTTWQEALNASVSHTLAFPAHVAFPGPVLTNSYGVVADAFVTGHIADPSATPLLIVADRMFARM